MHIDPDRQRSSLFASLLAGHDPQRPLTVLNIGVAQPETVQFFSGQRCTLHFVDLLDQLKESREDNHPLKVTQWLSFPAGTRFDLCLFWDFFNYLDITTLRAFTSSLKPWLHPDCRGHGLSLQHGCPPPPQRSYALCSEDRIRVRETQGTPAQWHSHPTALLRESVQTLAIDRVVLLSNGQLEFSLRTAPCP